MKEGPDIAYIASLIGDPARANILVALMHGKALTATELSREAGVTLQTASSHLAKLSSGGLIRPRKQGRHKYFSLASDAVGNVIENIMGLSARVGHLRTRTGPQDDALRYARICYNHLAGNMGIRMYDSMMRRGFLTFSASGIDLTKSGADFVSGWGIDLEQLYKKKTPLCRECLDWSERRSHLAGNLGRAIFSHMEGKNWTRRKPATRIIEFTGFGKTEFKNFFSSN